MRRPGPGGALVTGLTGQDGSFLAELLLDTGYGSPGMIRRPPTRAARLLRASAGPGRARRRRPARSAEPPRGGGEHVARRALPPRRAVVRARLLAALRPATLAAIAGVDRDAARGRPRPQPADARVRRRRPARCSAPRPRARSARTRPCRPETPYATAKLAAHQLVGQLRAHDGLFACSGILYNHESERRPESFVTRKITRAAAAIKLGLADHVELGDLSAVRDWSFAGDVMRGPG